jgi:uncharacterized protein YkwD
VTRRAASLLAAACLSAAVPAVLPGVASASAAPARALVAASCADAGLVPTGANAARIQGAVVCLLNAQRAAAGLAPLRASRSLGKAASGYARAMVREAFFAHVSPGGSTLVSRVRQTSYLRGAGVWALGEDIAWGAGSDTTPAVIVDAWMASPPHRRNILEPAFHDVGIGVRVGTPAPGVRDGATYVADFGARGR